MKNRAQTDKNRQKLKFSGTILQFGPPAKLKLNKIKNQDNLVHKYLRILRKIANFQKIF